MASKLMPLQQLIVLFCFMALVFCDNGNGSGLVAALLAAQELGQFSMNWIVRIVLDGFILRRFVA